MEQTDMRSPLAKARDVFLKHKEESINNWARESRTDAKYIRARLEAAFLAGANAQEKIDSKSTINEKS